MKGIIFTEFISMVEDKFGLETADEIISTSDLESEGAYTSVGTYDHSEILTLITALHKKTALPVKKLIHAFSSFLFNIFVTKYSHLVNKSSNCFDLLRSIDNYIHIEVKKLYPEAELPKFSYRDIDKDTLELTYKSQRPFADLAHGLISASIKHFNEDINLTSDEKSSYERTFTLTRNNG